MIRLTTPVVDPRVVPGLFTLGTLFALDTVRRVLAGGTVLEPALLALEMLAGILALGYALCSGDLRRPPAGTRESERLSGLRVGAGLVLLLFAVALGATVLGYLRLARLLASGVLGSAYLALLLNAQIRVLTGVAALVFRMEITGLALLAASIGVWVVNVLAFSLLYWQIDRGGPLARANNLRLKPDWFFPQVGVPEDVAPGWQPTYPDYLFLAYSTATAFSATDALPLTPRAKMLMMLQSTIALMTILIVASRAINIL
jgi:hypothetical protein